MRRRGGTRRIAAVAATVVALASIAGIAGCGNPQQSVRHCQGAPEESIVAIQEKLTAQGKLRNGKMVHLKSGPYFVSAEIHLDSDAPHDKGDIATWATDDIKSTDQFQSVDVHAREESTWPHVAVRPSLPMAPSSREHVSGSTPARPRRRSSVSNNRAPARTWRSRRARTAATYERHH